MSRLLAIEWDGREARLAVAEAARGRVRIERAAAIDLGPRDIGQTFSDPAVGKRLAEALAEHRVGRCETLVAVGRASIELKLLSLPPAPDDELPDLTRFQAQREFNAFGDDWPLDYLPIDRDPSQPRTVLAAAIPPQTVAQILGTCKEAGLEVKRLVLRPSAAASLLQRHRALDTACTRLLVDVLADEADLTVLLADTVVFMRTVRLPLGAPPAERSSTLLTEMRRTLAAVQNQLKGERVQEIVLCGVGEEYDSLVEQIDAALKLPTTRFDPFRTLQVDPALAGNLPAHPGRFAPLLGMLLDEAEGQRHGFDFLNPRQKPPPPNRRKLYLTAAAVAAAVLVVVSTIVWGLLKSRDEELELLEARVKQNDALLKQAAALDEETQEIEAWTAGDVVWLDKLAKLSREFPPPDDAMLSKLRINVTIRGASVQLDGSARTSATLTEIETRLRDTKHRVEGRGGNRDDRNPRYPWTFSSTLVIEGTAPAKAPGAPRGGARGRPALAPARPSPARTK